jgi:hypothetical protein
MHQVYSEVLDEGAFGEAYEHDSRLTGAPQSGCKEETPKGSREKKKSH